MTVFGEAFYNHVPGIVDMFWLLIYSSMLRANLTRWQNSALKFAQIFHTLSHLILILCNVCVIGFILHITV